MKHERIACADPRVETLEYGQAMNGRWYFYATFRGLADWLGARGIGSTPEEAIAQYERQSAIWGEPA